MQRSLVSIPLVLAMALGVAFGQVSAQESSVLIAGGRVLDGTGNPWVRADILVRGDRIVAIGDLAGLKADRVIDASGLYVAPGFIDAHSHGAEGLATERLSHGRPLLAMGLTTVFVNPDGVGPVDLASQRDDLTRFGLGVNVAQMIGHGSVRAKVVGLADRPATPLELTRMRTLVRNGMREGAWGLSSGTFYAPGSYAPPEEIHELALQVAPFGGVYSSHYRDESTYGIGLMAAVDEVIEVGRVAEIPAILTHVKVPGPDVRGAGPEIVARVEAARAEGIEVFADQYPYTASATGLEALLLPRWAQAGGRDSLLVRLADPAVRTRIRAEMVEGLARSGGADHLQFRRYRPDPSVEGRRLAHVAAERGQDPVDTAIDLIRGGVASIVAFDMVESDVETLMRPAWTMTSSDGDLVAMHEGVPHPRSYGAFARKLRVYVRERGVIGLEDAIRSMTSLPASVFGMSDRGVLRVGAAADIVVFDLAAVRDVADYDDPHRYAEGMVHVLVNGVAAIRDGEFTDELAGRVLEKGRRARVADDR